MIFKSKEISKFLTNLSLKYLQNNIDKFGDDGLKKIQSNNFPITFLLKKQEENWDIVIKIIIYPERKKEKNIEYYHTYYSENDFKSIFQQALKIRIEELTWHNKKSSLQP